MKKIVLLLMLVFSVPMFAQVQGPGQRKCVQYKHRVEFFAQMRAKKLIYLVDAMGLTEVEKAAFSVLFEENEEETSKCYRAMREAKGAMSAEPTEEEYKNAVEVARIQMLKIAQLRAEYLEKLEEILPAQKIYKLYEAEDDYKKLLIKDMGRCRQQLQK